MDSNENYIYCKINNKKVYSKGLGDIVDAGRQTWHNTGRINVDLWTNTSHIFDDILKYIAKKEEWRIEFINESWIQCYEDLRSGKLDMLGPVAFSEQRNQIFDFTYENVLSNWGQIYINKKSGIKSILDFNGKKIAVLQNDIYYTELKELVKQFGIQARFTEAFDYSVVFELVEAGECDAGLVNYLYGHQNERKYGINKTSIILSPQQINFAAPKDKNKQIINTLDQHLRKLKSDKHSIYYQSLSRWVGAGAINAKDNWLIGLSAGTLCLFLIFLVLGEGFLPFPARRRSRLRQRG